MHLPDFGPLKIAVIGDAMLDRYVSGSAQRISPEAPVPVILQRQVTEIPGGAANVASNIKALGGSAFLVSLVGDDSEAKTLSAELDALEVSHKFIFGLKHTVLKTRIMAGRQQLVRIDREEVPQSISQTNQMDLLVAAEAALQSANVLVLSDYAKGTLGHEVCTALIKKANDRGIPSIVDPKSANWAQYQGADIITPNLKEMREAIGQELQNVDDEVTQAARKLLLTNKIGAILVTRSEKGMSYITATDAVHSPATSREVFDVTGAGDTVLAMIALLMATSVNWSDRLRLANVAAGIAVGHVGTARVSGQEVLQTLQSKLSRNVQNVDDLLNELVQLRQAGKQIVFTNGCFDVLHRGHVALLEQAAQMGDVLIVGLNSDESVRRLKGPSRPINTLADRAFVLSSLTAVNYVVSFDDDTPAQLIAHIKPDVLVKGGDYKPDEVVGREHAGKTVIVPLVHGHSSTRIIEKRAPQ